MTSIHSCHFLNCTRSISWRICRIIRIRSKDPQMVYGCGYINFALNRLGKGFARWWSAIAALGPDCETRDHRARRPVRKSPRFNASLRGLAPARQTDGFCLYTHLIGQAILSR